MLISQLIVAPVVVFEAWLYLLLVRRHDPLGQLRIRDWVVIGVAAGLCMAALPLIARYESGANDRIWRPVLSTLSTFFVFPCVLLVGAWLRLGMRRGRRDKE